jgi:hypothetical protein
VGSSAGLMRTYRGDGEYDGDDEYIESFKKKR